MFRSQADAREKWPRVHTGTQSGYVSSSPGKAHSVSQRTLRAIAHGAPPRHHGQRVEMLLNGGADVNDKDSEGFTPLHWAAGGEYEVVKLLLDHGADVNAKTNGGKTPLYWAVLRVARRRRKNCHVSTAVTNRQGAASLSPRSRTSSSRDHSGRLAKQMGLRYLSAVEYRLGLPQKRLRFARAQ